MAAWRTLLLGPPGGGSARRTRPGGTGRLAAVPHYITRYAARALMLGVRPRARRWRWPPSPSSSPLPGVRGGGRSAGLSTACPRPVHGLSTAQRLHPMLSRRCTPWGGRLRPGRHCSCPATPHRPGAEDAHSRPTRPGSEPDFVILGVAVWAPRPRRPLISTPATPPFRTSALRTS